MKRILLTIAVVCVAAGQAEAMRFFDGQRDGFVFTLAAGPGITTVKYDDDGVKNDVTSGSLYLESKLGYGFSDRFQINIVNKMSIFDLSKMSDDYSNWFDKVSQGEGKGVLYLLATPLVVPFIPYAASHTTMGFSVVYFLEPEAPSFFFELGGGGAMIYNPFNDKTRGGRGVSLAVGYEFTEHVQPKLQFMYANYVEENPTYSTETHDRKTSCFSFSISLDYSFY